MHGRPVVAGEANSTAFRPNWPTVNSQGQKPPGFGSEAAAKPQRGGSNVDASYRPAGASMVNPPVINPEARARAIDDRRVAAEDEQSRRLPRIAPGASAGCRIGMLRATVTLHYTVVLTTFGATSFQLGKMAGWRATLRAQIRAGSKVAFWPTV